MKYTIEGFNQEYAITLRKTVVVGQKTVERKIDCTDLVILRWFVDFYPNMKKVEVDGKQYAWLTHKKLMEDLPLVDITKRAFIDRMQKLVDFNVLTYRLVKEGGTFSLYGFGDNYAKLIRSARDDVQNAQGMQSNAIGGMQSNAIGGCGQQYNKDNSINYSSFSNKSIIYNNIIAHLNKKAHTAFKASSKQTQAHINARLAEGFTEQDFKTVIDKKVTEWTGTEFEQYLRPATLFGTKFEGYLNAPVRERKFYGATGIEIKNTDEENDILHGIL